MKKALLLIMIMTTALLQVYAQGTYVSTRAESYSFMDRLEIKYSDLLPAAHSSTKPYLRSEIARTAQAIYFSKAPKSNIDSFGIKYLIEDDKEWADSFRNEKKEGVRKLIYREPASFLFLESKKQGLFDLRLNPKLQIMGGAEFQDRNIVFKNEIGLEMRANVKKVLSFYISSTESTAKLPAYVSAKYTSNSDHDSSLSHLAGNHDYVPGAGYFKTFNVPLASSQRAVYWFNTVGYVNINILDYLNISAGRDKNFWGDGVRSLFLSDNAAPYLFLKYRLSFWRVEYIGLIAQLTSDFSFNGNRPADKKYGTFHKLDISITHWLNMGLFEGNISRRSNNSFNPSYLNPIIFYRAVDHALGNPDKEFIGAYFKANALRHLSFYGQFLISEFNVHNLIAHNGWRDNKYALQLGAKCIDIVKGLDALAEFNMARPFTYSVSTFPEENYTNYNQALAHPLGNNFYEAILQMHYQPKPKWTLSFKLMLARVGEDTIAGYNHNYPVYSNLGGDIYRIDPASHDYGNTIGQGASGTIFYFNFKTTYQLWHNIYLESEILLRQKNSSIAAFDSKTYYWGIGLRVNLSASQYEF